MNERLNLSRRDFLELTGLGFAGLVLSPQESGLYWPSEVVKKIDTEEEIFALSIDDGWSKRALTDILDVLQERGFTATFFLVGRAVLSLESTSPGILRRLVENGHEIGYHTMTHEEAFLLEATSKDLSKDFTEWNELVKGFLGERLSNLAVKPYARAPYGLFTKAFITMCKEKGLTPFGWQRDPSDFNRGIFIERGDVVLLHVRDIDVNYLLRIQEFLKSPIVPAKLSDVLASVRQTEGNLLKEGEQKPFNWIIDTPPSLMLHSANWRQVKELIPYIEGNFSPTTYRKWGEKLQTHELIYSGFRKASSPLFFDRASKRYIPPSRLFQTSRPPLVLSIDDVGTDWIRYEHLQIMEDLLRSNIPAVIALQPNLVPEKGGKYWDLIKNLHSSGWEIASHTISHPYLPGVSQEKLEWEIQESARRIKDGVGEEPVTLILPFGSIQPVSQQTHEERIYQVAKEAGYKFIVGIGGGRRRAKRQDAMEYLGRIPPATDPQTTVKWLQGW